MPADALAAFDDGLCPDEPRVPSEWAAEHRPLPYDPALTPYTRAPLDAMGLEDPCEAVALQMPAQGGKTWVVAFSAIGYFIDHAPRDILIVEPNLDLVRRLVREKFDPLIAGTASLAAKVSTKRMKDSSNTIAYKEYPGGSVALVGANSPVGFKMTSRGIVIYDEVDDYPASVAGQGDALLLGEARQKTLLQSKRLYISTPTIKGLSRIVRQRERMARGYVWQMPCGRCGFVQELVWERLRYEAPANVEDVPDVIEGCWYQCVQCQGEIREAEKTAMLDAGSYVVEWDRGDRSKGFRVGGLCLPFPGAAWGKIAAKWERSRETPTERKVVVNADLGLPYEEEHTTPDWRKLHARREAYPLGVVPRGGRILTAFADLQGNRIEVGVVAWGRKEHWPIAHEVLPGDIETSAPWEQLAGVLSRDWPCEGGGTLPIMLQGVDTGHYAETAYRWIREHPQPWHGPSGVAIKHARTVAATKGRKEDLAVYLTSRRADGDKKRGVKVYLVGTIAAKLQVYQSLRLSVGTDGHIPQGYLHLPDFDPPWFQQLVAEKCITSGDRLDFEAPPSVRNEVLDIMVGNLWCAHAIGFLRWGPNQWARWEAKIPPGLLEPAHAVALAAPEDAGRVARDGKVVLAELEEVVATPVAQPAPTPLPARRAMPVMRSKWMTGR